MSSRISSGTAYILEYIKIVDFVLKSGKAIYTGREFRRYLLVPRQTLDQLMNKNQFDTIENKLEYWKQLKWIDTDGDRYTKKVTVNGKRIRMVKIDTAVYRALTELFDDLL